MTKISRETKIKLFMVGDNQFEVKDKEDNVLIDSDSDYFIYMKNVNFKNGNFIEGRYLGVLNDDSVILDKHCKTVSISEDGSEFTLGRTKLRTATMVAVNNKTKVIVIISK